jgi:hypothetical protein
MLPYVVCGAISLLAALLAFQHLRPAAVVVAKASSGSIN